MTPATNRQRKGKTIRQRARLRAAAGEAYESTVITATVPQDLAVWISTAAAREQVSKSDFVREVLGAARCYRDALQAFKVE